MIPRKLRERASERADSNFTEAVIAAFAVIADTPDQEENFPPTSGTSSIERAPQPRWLEHELRPIVGFVLGPEQM